MPTHASPLNPPRDPAILALYVAAGLTFLTSPRRPKPSRPKRRPAAQASSTSTAAAQRDLRLAAWKIDRRHRRPKSWKFGDPIPANWTRSPQKDPGD